MSLMFGPDDFFQSQVQRHASVGSNSSVHLLVHSTAGVDDRLDQPQRSLEPFQLTENMWICRLPDKYRDIVYEACESPGVPSHKQVNRQYGQLYTIALFAGPWLRGQVSSWDACGDITRFVTFSQLVHPTTIGFGNSAKFDFDPTGKFLTATPGPCRGMTEQAFTLLKHRNWISLKECEEIRDLLGDAKIEDLPPRVERARWGVQHAAYQYFFEVRVMLVASGLEALLHTSKKGTGHQFRLRTKQLADSLGIALSDKDTIELWEHRSDVMHGSDLWASRSSSGEMLKPPNDLSDDDSRVRLYLKAEKLLRAAVLKCLRDEQFAAKFFSDSSVELAFPLT